MTSSNNIISNNLTDATNSFSNIYTAANINKWSSIMDYTYNPIGNKARELLIEIPILYKVIGISKSKKLYHAEIIYKSHYWDRRLLLTFESTNKLEKVYPGDKFFLMNQWDKKYSNQELIDITKDDATYYNWIHWKLENKMDSYSIDEHKKLDDLLNIKWE